MEQTKTTDAKGRVALGKHFANKTVIIREVDATEVVVTMARVIPEREAWLREDEVAAGRVADGLAQAEARRFSDTPPDLDADAALVEELED